MTDIQAFLDEAGRLTRLPAKRKKQLAALAFLAGKFEMDKRYTEKEINALLNAWHTFGDPATLRRDLCDCGFLGRERDGSVYWLEPQQPDTEALMQRYG